MTFWGETEHFSGKNGALRWSILVGKQKHNVQKPTCNHQTTFRSRGKSEIECIMRQNVFSSGILGRSLNPL